jgi:uncharacterized protein (DUF58 family)
VVLSGVAAVLLVAALLPAVGLARVRVEVEAPRDATATRTANLDLHLMGRGPALKLRGIQPPGEWTAAEAPARGLVAVVPDRRGIVGEVKVELHSAAPLGLVWWRRRVTVALGRPMEVGPLPIESPVASPLASRPSGSDDRRAMASAADLVRSTRDYVAGDPIKLVHWTSTARYGDLMVKELEAPGSPVLALVVDLRPGGDEAELAAGRAAGIANAALAAGTPVTMLTAEVTGPRVGPVINPVEVGRRLARAVTTAPPPEGPLEDGTQVVRVSSGVR